MSWGRVPDSDDRDHSSQQQESEATQDTTDSSTVIEDTTAVDSAGVDSTELKPSKTPEKQEPGQSATFPELYEQGMTQLQGGHAGDAIPYFKEALNQNPDHLKTLVNLARAYVDIQQFQEALKTVDRIVAIDSMYTDAYQVRGRALQSLGQLEEAIKAYENAIKLNPQNPYALNNLGLIYVQQERFEEAIPLLEEAITQKNDLAYFHNNLGVAHEGQGDMKAAAEAFHAALKIDPDYEKARLNLERVEKNLPQDPQENEEVSGTEPVSGLQQ